jgi:hypothetical protein
VAKIDLLSDLLKIKMIIRFFPGAEERFHAKTPKREEEKASPFASWREKLCAFARNQSLI